LVHDRQAGYFFLVANRSMTIAMHATSAGRAAARKILSPECGEFDAPFARYQWSHEPNHLGIESVEQRDEGAKYDGANGEPWVL
jgi:hypothetical protein